MAQPNYFNAPIPGQSLTQDPSSSGPWERPPKFTNANQAIDHLFKITTSKKFMNHFDTLLAENKGFYVDEIAAGMLSEGFINGLWTVDVMMLLVEPLIIMLVWCAAQMDRSVSFSGDTGSEDRTGFDEMGDMYPTDEMTPHAEPEIQPDHLETPQSPLVNTPPQSPLVTAGGI